MKIFVIVMFVIVIVVFFFIFVVVYVDGFKILLVGMKIDLGFKMLKGLLQVGQINLGVFKNFKFIGLKWNIFLFKGGLVLFLGFGLVLVLKGGFSDGDVFVFGFGFVMVGVIVVVVVSSYSVVVYDDDGCWYEKQLCYKKSGKVYYKKVFVCE